MTSKARPIRFIHRPYGLVDANISDAVPDRVRTEAITGALEDLCREITLLGWDQPHQLGFLYQRARSPVGGELAQLGLAAVELEYSPLAGHEVFRNVERPHHVLLHLVDALRADLDFVQTIVPPDLIAVVLASETWMVSATKEQQQDPAWMEEMKAARRARQLHLHPARKECRWIAAVDVDYVRYAISQVRGEAPTHTVGLGTDTIALQGDVPNSLEYLTWVINGRDPGDWAEWWRKHYDYRDEEDKN